MYKSTLKKNNVRIASVLERIDDTPESVMMEAMLEGMAEYYSKNPYEQYEWKSAFVKLIPNAKYNENKKMVQLSIGDVNLLKDVRHFIYENGWYDEFQLNPKLLQCRLDFFIDLCSRLEETISISEESKSALKKLEANEVTQSAIKKIVSGSFEDGVKELVANASKGIIVEVLKLLPFGGLASKAVQGLITVLTK